MAEDGLGLDGFLSTAAACGVTVIPLGSGVGSLRPFVKEARPLPPPEVLYAMQPGPVAETMGNTGGLMGFLVTCWCAASPRAPSPTRAPR